MTRLSRKPNRPLRFLPCRDDDNGVNLRMAVDALPETRSAKIIRRAIRAPALGMDPGDLSGAENPDAVNQIRRLVFAQETPVDA